MSEPRVLLKAVPDCRAKARLGTSVEILQGSIAGQMYRSVVRSETVIVVGRSEAAEVTTLPLPPHSMRTQPIYNYSSLHLSVVVSYQVWRSHVLEHEFCESGSRQSRKHRPFCLSALALPSQLS